MEWTGIEVVVAVGDLLNGKIFHRSTITSLKGATLWVLCSILMYIACVTILININCADMWEERGRADRSYQGFV